MNRLLYATLAVLLFSSRAFAQMPYTFTVYNQTYVPLDTATRIDSGYIWSNYDYFSAPIGFPFMIDTIHCTDFFSEGGNVSISDTAFVTASAFFLTNASLDDRGYTLDTASHSPVRYKVTGPVGNRIFKFETFNAGFDQQLVDSNKMTDSADLQTWYYEDSGIVELRYGPSLVTGTDYFFPGMIAGYGQDLDTNGNGTLYILGGDPVTPMVQTVPIVAGNPTVPFAPLASFPPSGTVYRFKPFNIASLGVADVIPTDNIFVYPTVSSSDVMIKYTGSEIQNYEVVSISGAQTNIKGQVTKGLTHIDVSNLPAGMYLVHIQGGANSKVYKFVKA